MTVQTATPSGCAFATCRRSSSRSTRGSRSTSLGTVRYDMAFGGNFYALVAAASVGLEPVPARIQELIDAGLEIARRRSTRRALPVHPLDPAIRGCKHVVFHSSGHNGAHARNATAIHPGWLDRSPCGTGTSARMAALHAPRRAGARAGVRQRVGDRQPVHRPSARGDPRSGSMPAVVPEVSGRAWITAMGQYLLDPTDPFPTGFAL